MQQGDFRAIPDLVFQIELLVAASTHVASRLQFDCTPAGTPFGLAVNGGRVQFEETFSMSLRLTKLRASDQG